MPLTASGYFSMPLFHILNWYTLLIGLFGLVVLCAHGATFLAWRAEGEFAARMDDFGRELLNAIENAAMLSTPTTPATPAAPPEEVGALPRRRTF